MIIRKTVQQLEAMRRAGKALAEVFDEIAPAIKPGLILSDLDALAEKLVRERGATPSFLGYKGFPGSACLSPNQVIVHGIPNGTRLKEGDIISVDVGLILDGWHADSAYTYPVGMVDPVAQKLLDVTRDSLEAGIKSCRPGRRLGDVGHAIQTVVESAGFSVVREYSGHQIGRDMHEGQIQVPNYGNPGRGIQLEPGMVFALEPMVNVGDWKTKTLSDGWAVVTADGSLSAHFEHTVAVTERGPLVLTRN